jgi:uroporphyrinogen decarboxylase
VKLENDRFLRALRRQPVDATPVWIMRQAGRYLPEYRATRARAGSFLALAKNPELACEVTLQPLDRFALDAAILFSDILTVPDAMGLGLYFADGEGPRFERPVRSAADIAKLAVPDMEGELGYVMDAVRLIRRELRGRVPLIGFSGSPWTLACYMIEGGGSDNFARIKSMAYSEPAQLHRLLEVTTEAVIAYLSAQRAAGAQALQVFDTWGGVLSPRMYREFSLRYLTRIAEALPRGEGDERTPLILFGKGNAPYLEELAASGTEAVGVDWLTFSCSPNAVRLIPEQNQLVAFGLRLKLGVVRLQGAFQLGFLEQHDAQNLENFVQAGPAAQTLAEDRDQHVDRNRDPHLHQDRVLRPSVERLDPKVLLDPAKEDFDAPPLAIQRADGGRSQCEVVGEQNDARTRLGIAHANASKRRRVLGDGDIARQHDRVVADNARTILDLVRVAPPGLQILLGTHDEERPRAVPAIEPREVEVTAVQQIDRTPLGLEPVEHVDVVTARVGQLDDRGNRRTDLEQGVQLDAATPGMRRVRPRKRRKAYLHRGRVEHESGLGQIAGQWLVGVQRQRRSDQVLSQLGEDPPVALLVGIGQGASRDTATYAQMEELGLMGAQAQLDVAQALAPGQLREGHAQELVEARKALHVALAAVLAHGTTEGRQRKLIHQLRKDESTLVHGVAPPEEATSLDERGPKSVTTRNRQVPPSKHGVAPPQRKFPRTALGLSWASKRK